MNGDDGIVWYLRITEENLDSVLVLAMEGRVFSQTTADFDQRLNRSLGQATSGLIVDLSAVDYINGEGLQRLDAAAARARAAGRVIVVCGLSAVVRTAFELAGTTAHVAVEPSREAAMRRLGVGGRLDAGRG